MLNFYNFIVDKFIKNIYTNRYFYFLRNLHTTKEGENEYLYR